MNGYTLIRNWYNFKFENPDKVKHAHSDFYCYLVDQWNRLGQKENFGLPTFYTMECLGIGSYNTYKKVLNELIDFGFVILVKDSKNQHHSKIIALSNIDKALDKPLDKASAKALDKPLDEALDNISKQINNETNKQLSEYEIKKNQLLGLYNEVKNTASFEGVKMALNSIVNQKLNYDLMIDDFINFAITQDKTYKKPIDFSNHFQNYYKTKDLTKYFIIENNNDIDFEKVLEVYNRVFKRNQTYLTNEEKNIVIKAFNDFGKEKINKALEKASKDDFLVDINPQNLSRKFKSFVNIEFLFKYKTLHKYSNL